jgi:alkanesulfonate monooxygenase SsuD/methylene tetrahydromethanopterin reductase-like flavin-dependent oxidoreductase (luciferase family)
MKVGLALLFEGRTHESDAEMFEQELALGLEAEALGFDRVMAVEHHFTDYAMCPDNAQVLSYIAARTSRIELMPGAFILPWNDPIRVAEKAILLDHMSGGRAIIGMGRGLARREFEAFGVDMSESRERYDEAAAMILEALETGFIEGDGPFYPQKRTELRPRPLKSYKGRAYMVGGSPSSLLVAAELGLDVMQFGVAPTPDSVAMLEPYRTAYEAKHGTQPAPLLTADLMLCDRDAKKAEELAREHQADYWYAVMNHYELLSHHFEDTRGAYDMYAQVAEGLRNDRDNAAADAYVDANLWGDPEHIIEQLRAKYETFGGVDLAVMGNYSDMPYELVRSSIKLFAEEVLPVVQSWPEKPAATSAASS